jgi:hypothetical protein
MQSFSLVKYRLRGEARVILEPGSHFKGNREYHALNPVPASLLLLGGGGLSVYMPQGLSQPQEGLVGGTLKCSRPWAGWLLPHAASPAQPVQWLFLPPALLFPLEAVALGGSQCTLRRKGWKEWGFELLPWQPLPGGL